jgi:hypothetical protein
MGHFKNKLLSDSDFVFKRMNSPKHHHLLQNRANFGLMAAFGDPNATQRDT